jgi:hypothetical protein
MPSDAIQRQLRKLHKLYILEVTAIRQAATLIGGWELTETGFDAGLTQFEQLLQNIHNFAMRERNNWMLGVCKSVSIALGQLLASRLPLSYDHLQQLKTVSKPIPTQTDTEHFQAFYTNEVLSHLCSLYRERYNTALLMGQVSEEDLSYFDDFRQPDKVKEAIQSLLTGITELRHYGVKSCIMQDGLLHDPAYAWAMADGADFMSHLMPNGATLSQFDPPLAVTMLTSHKGINNLKTIPQKEKLGRTPFRRVSFNFGSCTAAIPYSDGRMTLDIGYGMVPLKGIFDEAGVGELYELFHLVQLLRISDLVIPVKPIGNRRIPAWPTRHRKQATLPEGPEPTWRQLVVPRLLTLRDSSLSAQIEQEIAEDRAFTAQYGGTHESREILGFLRRLQPGRQASERAHGLAMEERGWEKLPEGYTYVKNHTWGTGPNLTAGHVAIRRPL